MAVYGIVCRRCCADELSAGELHSKRSLQWKDGGGGRRAKIRREKSSRVFDADALFITVV